MKIRNNVHRTHRIVPGLINCNCLYICLSLCFLACTEDRKWLLRKPYYYYSSFEIGSNGILIRTQPKSYFLVNLEAKYIGRETKCSTGQDKALSTGFFFLVSSKFHPTLRLEILTWQSQTQGREKGSTCNCMRKGECWGRGRCGFKGELFYGRKRNLRLHHLLGAFRR